MLVYLSLPFCLRDCFGLLLRLSGLFQLFVLFGSCSFVCFLDSLFHFFVVFCFVLLLLHLSVLFSLFDLEMRMHTVVLQRGWCVGGYHETDWSVAWSVCHLFGQVSDRTVV